MSHAHVETEDTFDVDDRFVVPSLTAAVPDGGRVETVTTRLRSTYVDTADLTLLGARVTLRRREGDDDRGWHLKVPAGASRTEIHRPLGDDDEPVPPALAALVSGLVDPETLVPVAVVATVRVRHRILDAGGALVVEVDDDRVEATPADGPARHWREVEVELGTGPRGALAQIGSTLRDAGAVPAGTTSKLARALAVDAPTLGAPAATALHAYLAAQVDAIVAGDVELRRGLDPVHATRVATRRFRSAVRVFARFLDTTRVDPVDSELQWWAGVLGEARDAQVQRARHLAALDTLPPELVLGPVRARIEQDTTGAEARARERITAEQGGERYRSLLRELLRWRAGPPFTAASDSGLGAVSEAAAAADRTAGKRLRQAVRDGDDELLHRARKAAKRARYAHELLRDAPVSKAERRTAKAVMRQHKAVQAVLGDHQDGVVAAALLRRLGAQAGARGENGFTFGLLWQREQQGADEARRRVLEL